MNDSKTRIPKEIVPEVFALAARLQSAQQQSYSLAELTQIGAEANIPPEDFKSATTKGRIGNEYHCREWIFMRWRSLLCNSKVFYGWPVSGAQGLHVSTDGGKTWTQPRMAGLGDAPFSLAVDPQNPRPYGSRPHRGNSISG